MRRLSLLAVAVLVACQSAPPPPLEPEIQVERYPLPIYYALEIEELEPPELEEVPTIPPANPDPELRAAELKAWSLEVNRVTRENRAKRDAYIKALKLQIQANNEIARANPPPTPTPEPSP